MFGVRSRAGLVVGAVVVVVGVVVYVWWPRVDSVTVPSVVVSSPATVAVTVVAGPVTTLPAVSVAATTTTLEVSAASTTVVVEAEPAGEPAVVSVPDGTPRSSATTVAVVSAPVEEPTFDTIEPAYVWPDRVSGANSAALERSVEVWNKVEAFFSWYMTEGHPMADSFDAHQRPELAPQAAGQINWVHHRFWSDVVPRWDRVWNDAWAAEREQQREWIMILANNLLYNNPDQDMYQRYWGPNSFVADADFPSGYRPVALPLFDVGQVETWLAERGYAPGVPLADIVSEGAVEDRHRAYWAPDDPLFVGALPQNPYLDPQLPIWQEWASTMNLEAVLGPQAAGGKLGPAPGELWYQWHPDGFDTSPLGNSVEWADVFGGASDWWPQRLEVPVHNPASMRVGGAVGPQSPDTGNFYFEVCLWASGGLFGPWSMPHPDLDDASANTTWRLAGWANPDGQILEISQPANRPCLPETMRWSFEKQWTVTWKDLNHSVEGSLLSAAEYEALHRRLIESGAPSGNSTPEFRKALIDLYDRNDLGHWFWREHPNPAGPSHEFLGWDPINDYDEPPATIGIMIHPLYIWNPDGQAAGYPAGDTNVPLKWVPVSPARDHIDAPGYEWQISYGGCHNPDEPYMWSGHGSTIPASLTTDGGPVWSWPGTVWLSGLKVVNQWREEGLAEIYAAASNRGDEHRFSPRTYAHHVLWGPYYPPVPCQDITAGKYEPDWTGHVIAAGAYPLWTATLGDHPHPDWTNPAQR